MRLQMTEDGKYIIIDGNGNDALEISENRNGTLELTFLSTGAWSTGTGRLYGDKKTTVGIARAYIPDATSKPKVHPAHDFNQDHEWHYRDDPYPYVTGAQGLSIAESANRAVDRIQTEIWDTYGPIATGDEEELFGVIGELIAKGVGRNYVYRLAGRAKNTRKPFSPTSLTTIFKHLAAIDGYATS